MEKEDFISESVRHLTEDRGNHFVLSGQFVGEINRLSQDSYKQRLDVRLNGALKRGDNYIRDGSVFQGYHVYLDATTDRELNQEVVDGYVGGLAEDLKKRAGQEKYRFHKVDDGEVFIENLNVPDREETSKDRFAGLFNKLRESVENL